jgi:hypothetical protein
MAQNEAASLRNTAPIYRKRAARERRIFANGLEAARRSKLSGEPQRKLIKRAERERRASRVRRAARRFLADEFAVSYPQAAISRLFIAAETDAKAPRSANRKDSIEEQLK